MQREKPGLAICHGFDISHYQPDFGAAMAKVQDPLFCFLKATEGITHVDPCFKAHRESARMAGLCVGSYHFFRPTFSPVVQARHMASVVGALQPGDLPCVLDWEITSQAPAATDVIAALEFLNAIEALTGRTPIIYGSPYFLQHLNMNEHFLKYPLWIAEYGVSAPLMPIPWATAQQPKKWAFWQTADKGLDLNVFNGSVGDLKMLAGKLA